MSFDAHANLATSLLTNSPGTAGTTFNVTTGTGALFPAVPFNCLVVPANTLPTTSNAEIVRCTAYTTDSFTVTRAQEGTTAVNAVASAVIAAFLPATGSFTLANATVTVVSQSAVQTNSVVFFTPTNATAALTVRTAGLYWSNTTTGTSFSVSTQTGSAIGTETFKYVVITP